MSGRISGRVNTLTQATIQEMTRKIGKDSGDYKYKIKDYKDLVETEPLSKACIELKCLRLAEMIGEYEHEDKPTQTWIRSNFETMRGSIVNVVRQLGSALPYGYAVAEVVTTSNAPGYPGEWRLDEINVLDPEKVTFAGRLGRIDGVWYNDGNGPKKWIPYSKVIHVMNGSCTIGRPYGSPEAERAMPYYKAKQLLFSEMMVAGKNSATGILLAQADSNDTVYIKDSDGNPIKGPDGNPRKFSAVEALNYQLQNLESSGIITTDLKNRLSPILIPSGDQFWNYAIMLIKKEILLSFLTPSLIWDEGSFSGLGNTGISGNHKAILDANIGAVATQIQEELLEKVIRPLMVWNVKKSVWKKNFGNFAKQPYNDPNFLATQASNLIAAISSQILPSSDIDVMNALREALGIAPVTEDKMMDLVKKQIDLQVMQQSAMTPVDPAADPNAGMDAGQTGFSYW